MTRNMLFFICARVLGCHNVGSTPHHDAAMRHGAASTPHQKPTEIPGGSNATFSSGTPGKLWCVLNYLSKLSKSRQFDPAPCTLVGPNQYNTQETAQPTKFGRLVNTGHRKTCRCAVSDIGNGANGKNLLVWSDESSTLDSS
jgi:hypothetical protein